MTVAQELRQFTGKQDSLPEITKRYKYKNKQDKQSAFLKTIPFDKWSAVKQLCDEYTRTPTQLMINDLIKDGKVEVKLDGRKKLYRRTKCI